MAVVITGVEKASLAKKYRIKPGDVLLRINGHEITDILDYMFYSAGDTAELEVSRDKKRNKSLRICKEDNEDLGLVFDDYLMSSERRCMNKCIFCFIDQLPSGMRDSLYVKDDDERLSFLFGNYLSLTNLTDRDIERIIEMNISPVNVSVHTTNPELRNYMMGNPDAGRSLEKLYRMAQAGIGINCQVVLCKGVNDKEELDSTLNKLTSLYPSVLSISIVPSGLTGYRANLKKLEPFSKEDALLVLKGIEKRHKICSKEFGNGLVYPADEWYILADKPLPELNFYGELYQLENGVGMLALLKSEFLDALESCKEFSGVTLDIVTGEAAYGWICSLFKKAKEKFPQIVCRIHCIKNIFFGGRITVAGLLTATDIMTQLKPENVHGGKIAVPRSVLRGDGDLFLDDITLEEFSGFYKKQVVVVSNGYELFDAANNTNKE